MKFFKRMKDGGPDSKVTGYFLAEIKSLFTVVLLRFDGDSREAFHTHAFNALSWVLKGELAEFVRGSVMSYYEPSIVPVYTPRDRFHKVSSYGITWVLSFRGPWAKTWKEFLPETGETLTLEHGRGIIDRRFSVRKVQA